MDKSGVVAMRLFANWEMDRTSSSAVQRVFSISINRLLLDLNQYAGQPLVITVKLQGHKRSIRSNEIPLNIRNGRIDIDLDVSFTIQYPHFLKRKRNIIQIMIQRKRKYKNRPIPGGFKTLALGFANLTQLLQQGGIREISLSGSEDLDKEATAEHRIGRLQLTACQTTPSEVDCERERERLKKAGHEGEISEDDSDSEFDDLPVDSDLGENSASVNRRQPGLNMKQVRRKNIKQKLANLIKKFKEPEAGNTTASTPSIADAPTAKELEALFEELDDLSDSGHEMAPDEISIGSNPRPVLRPFFTRSREILPAIYDGDPISESDGEVDSSSDERERVDYLVPTRTATAPKSPSKSQLRVGFTTSAPVFGSHGVMSMPHSQTTGSIRKELLKTDSRNMSVTEKLSSLLSSNSASVTLWLCASEAAHILSLPISSVPCASASDVKLAMTQIVARIHKYCNSNSSNPPVTLIGIIGGDRFVGHVLRAYVDCLHHKSSSNWLQYLRFALLPPPHCHAGRLIYGVDHICDQVVRDIWERWTELTPTDTASLSERLNGWSKAEAVMHLPIGEALLQLADTIEGESGSVFVPFLSEVRVGQSDDDCDGMSPRMEEQQNSKEPAQGGGSPPCSPHSRSDAREMTVEYWVARDPAMEFTSPASSQAATPNAKSNKGSMKTSFRSLMITRSTSHQLLTFTFVKEKKKDKMLQKLGMKKGQKSDSDFAPVQVSNVARLLCSGSGKHNDLNVAVDGCVYHGVRYFQTSAQWQTHLKSFPLSLFSYSGGFSFLH